MKPLALDIGNRYIGVAATDHMDRMLAYRYATIDRKVQDAFTELRAIIQRESIDTLILGIPYHVEDGSETAQTKKTREFITALREQLGESVAYIEVDETLTSKQAKENLTSEEIDGTQEHAEAARIMLQECISQGT